MAVLASFPYETLSQVLSLLSGHDLASTARVSRRFLFVSQPLLYKAPHLRKSPGGNSTAISSLRIFIRTLRTSGRESLASHVRSLYFEWDDTRGWRDNRSRRVSPTLTESDPGIGDTPESQGEQFMLLLDLLPQLQVLRLSSLNFHPSFSSLLKTSADHETLPCGLNSLRKVHFTRTESCHGIPCDTLAVFLQLPRIRIIDLSNINRLRISSREMKNAASSSPVTHLRFSHADIPHWLLGQVLMAPIALTHFSYTTAPIPLLTLSGFMAKLAPLRPSLQYLHLNFANSSFHPYIVDHLPHEEAPLREWPVLRTLSCDMMTLLGYGRPGSSRSLMDVLPPCIQQLEILPDGFCCLVDNEDKLLEMLAVKQRAAPRLERLAVVVEPWESQYDLGTLVTACEAAGVSFVQDSFLWEA